MIDGGRVVERGTHQELVAADGLYAQLSRTQFVIADRDAVDTEVPGRDLAEVMDAHDVLDAMVAETHG